MDIKIKKKGEAVTVKLSGDMIINYASLMKEKILEEFDTPSKINVDLSGVSRIDTSGFQFLLFLKREAVAHDKDIKLQKPSHDVQDIFKLYGEDI